MYPYYNFIVAHIARIFIAPKRDVVKFIAGVSKVSIGFKRWSSLSKIAFSIVTLVVIVVLEVLKQLMKIYSKLTIRNALLEFMQIKNPSKPELFITTLSTAFCINKKLLHCRSNWLRYDEHSIIWLQWITFKYVRRNFRDI